MVSLEHVSQRHTFALLSGVTGTRWRVQAEGEQVQPPLLSHVTHSAMPVCQNILHHKYFAPKVASYNLNIHLNKHPPGKARYRFCKRKNLVILYTL